MSNTTFYTPKSQFSEVEASLKSKTQVSPKGSPKGSAKGSSKWSSKSAKGSPKSAKGSPKRSSKSAKGSPKRSPKGSPKGSSKSAKVSPKSAKSPKTSKSKVSPTMRTIGSVGKVCAPFLKGTGDWRNLDEIREHVSCVPDRKHVNQFYHRRAKRGKLAKTAAFDHFGNEQDMSGCLTIYNDATGQSVTLDQIADCHLENISVVNPGYGEMLKYLQALQDTGLVSDTILEFLGELVEYTNVTAESLREILNGAFTVIRGDNGFFYRSFKQTEDAMTCSEWVCGIAETSHDSMDPQYRLGQRSMVGPELLIDRERAPTSHIFDLLVGTSVLPGDLYRCTWFQFEYARLTGQTMLGGLWNRVVEHLVAFVKYKSTGRNQGVFGGSVHAEYNKPLILDLCGMDWNLNSPKACVSPEIRLKTADPFKITESYWSTVPDNYFKGLVALKNLVRNVVYSGLWHPATYHTATITTNLRQVLKELMNRRLCVTTAKKESDRDFTIPEMIHAIFEHVTKNCRTLFRNY